MLFFPSVGDFCEIGMLTYSPVSSSIQRTKRQIDDDSKLGKRIAQLKKTYSQASTAAP
jgi:hypothetical protein